ncbi:MAG: flagellar motor switch phosphatase FliY [Cyanobacteriota bacterium]
MSDNLSQEDIDRLLSGMSDESGFTGSGFSTGGLDDQEKETLSEICTMTMGAAANTLAEVLNNKVEIDNANIIEFSDILEVIQAQENTTVIDLKYQGSLEFSQLLILKNSDTAAIADIIMGGNGQVDSAELGDIQLNAVRDVINQMMISATENLSSIFERKITVLTSNIQVTTPEQPPIVTEEFQNKPLVGIAYRFIAGAAVDSDLLLIFSQEMAQSLVQMFLGSVDSLLQGSSGHSSLDTVGLAGMNSSRMFGNTQGGQDNSSGAYGAMSPGDPVTIQPARFSPLDGSPPMFGEEHKNLELLLDVSLKLSVELGRSELPIKKVLELTRGSVIELDKVAGEAVDLLANGKLIAKGEVVVIEDNFGLRITSIISPADRLKNL